MYIGKNITELRKQHNLTQEQLAEKCGVSRQAVTKWESGESEPNIERLVMLADVFKVTIDEIVKGTDAKETCNKLYNDLDVACIFKRVESAIFKISFQDRSIICDYDREEHTNLYILWDLYYILKQKYVDKNGDVYREFLVKNTSSDEREYLVFHLSGLGKYDYDYVWNDYITGKCEINKAIDTVMDDISARIESISPLRKYSRTGKYKD